MNCKLIANFEALTAGGALENRCPHLSTSPNTSPHIPPFDENSLA